MKLWPAPALVFLLAVIAMIGAGHPVRAGSAELAVRAFGGIQPSVSPDGKWIACSYQGAVCRLPVEGGALTRLTRGAGWDVHPVWSPDGGRIALINTPNLANGTLAMIDAVTGKAVPLPAVVQARGSLAFHPDGSRLLGIFVVGDVFRLAWYNLSDATLEPINGPTKTWAYRNNPVFAIKAGAREVLYVEHRDLPGEQGGNNGPQATVWALPAHGENPAKSFEWPARIYGLCPEPAGNSVLLVSDLGGAHYNLWRVPFDNPEAGAEKLTFGQGDADAPSIDQRGGLLVHSDNASGATALVSMNLASGERRVAAMTHEDFGEPGAHLALKLVDKADGTPVVARVTLRQNDGKFFAPPGALYRMSAGYPLFYARGEASLEVPAGRFELTIFRGPEYRPANLEVVLAPNETRALTVALERWVDMAAEGWYSGENHIHANYGYGAWYNSPRTILDQIEGEDLNVANLVAANSDGDGVFDREYFRGGLDPLSTSRHLLWWNEEFRSTLWGHMTLFHLHQLIEPIFTGFAGTTNPWDVPTNGDVAQHARAVGGVVSYTHPTSNREDPYNHIYGAKGLPVDIALGQIDALDVMGSLYDASVPFWYRFLNCGFRLPAAAGTDVFLNRIPTPPPGWGRVYVHLPHGLTYDGWVDGVKAGRSFVSNGPVLDFEVSGKGMGDTLALDGPGQVHVQGRARAQFPLSTLELVLDGEVVATGNLAGDKSSATLDTTLAVDHSGWVALRVSGPVANGWVGSMAAHSNPVWLEVKDRPQPAASAAAYFLPWIDRLEGDLKKRERLPPGGEEHVGQHLTQARRIFAGIAQGRLTAPQPEKAPHWFGAPTP
jgi:hypothetical protein